MVKIEEVTSFVSSFIDKYFGPKTVWPGIAEDVHKTGLKLMDVAASVYDASAKAISAQFGGCSETKDSAHHCGCSEPTQETKTEIKEADAPMAKSAATADTEKPARKPRVKKDPNADAAKPKTPRTRKPKV
ncbi:MAG: hypothetical protein L7F77_11025 [Candidatus Magnetominusculus sp. LBB02]|nr:hypothetical protein [Candidatus Magnetominusculus sp. LBB02]